MAAEGQTSKYEEAIEDGEMPKEAQTVHRIRANSTIMQLNKILGQYARLSADKCSREATTAASRGDLL